jgi:hypothetical protein
MRIGFLARIQDREGVYLIALTPGDRQFAPTVTTGQSFLDLGDDIAVEPAVTVASIVISGNDQGDQVGSLLVDGEGVCALAVAPHEDEMRYYDFITGNVTTTRPGARVHSHAVVALDRFRAASAESR